MATNTNKQSYLNKARKDKFILVFSLPNALKTIDNDKNGGRSTFNVSEDSMQFSVYGAVVPEIVVPAIQIGYAGSNLYNSSHAREPYPPVKVDFTIDNEFNNYWTMYKWLNLMHDQKKGLYDAQGLAKDEFFKNYQTDLTLYGLDEYDNRRIEWQYTKAFPINLGSIDYSYRDGTEAASSMTFVYSQINSKLINR